jgi:hypothetical protein
MRLDQRDSALFDRSVACMHAAPYSEQFNNNVLKPFNYYVMNFPNLMFCLYGHGHQIDEHDFFNNGIIFVYRPVLGKVLAQHLM